MKRVLPALVSAVVPGAGQLLNHHWTKGIAILAAGLTISAMLRKKSILAQPMHSGSALHWVLVVVLVGLAVWSALDAYRSNPSPAGNH